MDAKKAIKQINKDGVLLVFPIKNDKVTPSLWQRFYPRSTMKWEWDAGADGRVAELWHLREELSRSSEVAYAKWFKGRATFFSLPVFNSLLTISRQTLPDSQFQHAEARRLLQELMEDSPQSVRTVKANTGLAGYLNESAFTRGMKELWNRLLIVGHGEIADGAFPSLAVGATKWMFEESWENSANGDVTAAKEELTELLSHESPFLIYSERMLTRLKPRISPTTPSNLAER